MGYTPPAVGVANSAADVAYMYRDYADKNGGDTEANRSAAIDYLRQSGVSDATIGSSYDSYLAKGGYQAPAEAASYLVPGGFGGEMIDSRTLGGGTPGGGMDSAKVFTGYAKPLLISSGAQPSGSVTAAANTPQIDGLYSGASSAPQLGYNLADVAGAATWNVDNNQLVASQLEKIIASDSPLMQQARAQALQQMNARGTLNSSMAETAAQSAVIAAADKIAQADAATYGDAAQYNADATNTFTREGNAFIRQGVMADYNVNANEWAAQQAYASEMAAQREQNAFNLAAMERENELNKGNTTSANSQSDRQGYINALNQARTDWADKYAALMVDPNMSPENKRAALKSLSTSYNTQIKQYTGLLGWDYASWDIEYDDTEDATPATPAAATTQTDGGGGY